MSRKYNDHLIILLVFIIFVLLFILITDVHVAKINREINRTISQPF